MKYLKLWENFSDDDLQFILSEVTEIGFQAPIIKNTDDLLVVRLAKTGDGTRKKSKTDSSLFDLISRGGKINKLGSDTQDFKISEVLQFLERLKYECDDLSYKTFYCINDYIINSIPADALIQRFKQMTGPDKYRYSSSGYKIFEYEDILEFEDDTVEIIDIYILKKDNRPK